MRGRLQAECRGNERFEELIQPLGGSMLATIWRIVRHADDVDDAHQDALMRIWKQLGRIERHPNPAALILRICTQTALDTLRRRSGLEKRISHSGETQHRPDHRGSLAPENLRHEERAQEILQEISRLPDKQAVAVLMRTVQKQPYQEIAEALGCREATARSHVALGRAVLRRKLSHLMRQKGIENL